MIKKIDYELIINEQRQKIFFYKVSHSIYTPTATAVLVTEKKPEPFSKIDLKLGIDGESNIIFKGYIVKIEKHQSKYKLFANNTYHLTKDKITISLKDVNPKQILNHIGIKNITYTKKNLPEKHHFPILSLNRLQVIKQIIKTWNLKDFVYYLDLQENLHFHHKNEYWDKQTEIEKVVVKNTGNYVILPLTTNIYINQKISIKDNVFKVTSITHTEGKTYIEVENV